MSGVRSEPEQGAVLVEPAGPRWGELVRSARADGALLGRPASSWRLEARCELGLPDDRPIIATGHQTLLWHPGILAKYLAVQAATRRDAGVGLANLIVDQHASGFGTFDAPVRRADGTLAVRRIHLATERAGVPMALHPPVTPRPPERGWNAALPAVAEGVDRIVAAVARHADRPNAALQMGAAIAELMAPWVGRLPSVTSSALLGTGLGRRLLETMAEAPRACAEHYNRALAATPDVDVTPLRVGREYVELPVWRTREDGRRVRAYDVDVQRWIDDPGSMTLFPRALLLTALVRLVLADLFVHGTGGARYDRAMEGWVRGWLGVEPAPKAVVSATLRLPLHDGLDASASPVARATLRRAWHDPERLAGASQAPGPRKRVALDALERAERRSPERRRLFDAMHRMMRDVRDAHHAELCRLHATLDEAERAERSRPVAERRTWPFPLYPPEQIDALARQVGTRFG